MPHVTALINIITLKKYNKNFQQSKKMIVTIKTIEMNMLINMLSLTAQRLADRKGYSFFPQVALHSLSCCRVVTTAVSPGYHLKSQMMINTIGSDNSKRPLL